MSTSTLGSLEPNGTASGIDVVAATIRAVSTKSRTRSESSSARQAITSSLGEHFLNTGDAETVNAATSEFVRRWGIAPR